uniref:Transmembrane protein 56 n=1 Tax=Schistocephalus solidus TaxID=70667 RepID=A0A0X3P340_SCHSO
MDVGERVIALPFGPVGGVGKIYINQLMIASFLFCVVVHHVISPLAFGRCNAIYRSLNKNRRMEWDSRVVSSIHATIVSVLCVLSLIKERGLWQDPLFATGDIALHALSISIGYFLCDLISMPIYYKGKNLAIFIVHHSAALIAFYLIFVYRIGTFFGVYRLTTELSTPFTNQRWFFRTLGYTPDRRRVALTTLVYSVLFALTRNALVLPYWIIAYTVYNSPEHLRASRLLPNLTRIWFTASLTLDALNTYWAVQVYPIGYRAAVLLYTADWRTDIDRAKARLRGRFQSARRRAMNTKLIKSLRRTASFGRIHRVFSGPSFPYDFDVFPEVLSEPEFDDDSGTTTPKDHSPTSPLNGGNESSPEDEQFSSAGLLFRARPEPSSA